MSITLRQLEIFAAVARHNSVSKAAVELGLSQPAVSKQIHQMEKQLGVPVIDIIKQRVHITQMGGKVLNHARGIEELLHELNDTVSGSSEGLSGELRIGTGTSMPELTVHRYANFVKLHPNVSLKLLVGHRFKLNDSIHDNNVDFLIVPDEYSSDDIEKVPLCKFNFVLACHKKNPLSKKKRLKLSELSSQRFVRYAHSHIESNLLDDLFCQNPSMQSLEMNSVVAIKCALSEGLGVAMLPDYSLGSTATKDIVVLDVEGLPITSSINLIHLKNKKLTQTMQTFKEFLLSEFG